MSHLTADASGRVVCVDVGSTFTKAALVDLGDARLLGTAAHRTTIGSDVLDGLDACVAELGAAGLPVLACSSAGGGLRIAVVGNEALVTAEAGRRVALSSGGSVVAVLSRADDQAAYDDLGPRARPDLVLLTGGTDGGDAGNLLRAAERLRASGWAGPVVLAGNADAVPEVAEVLAGVPVTVAANVLPRIGVLEPGPARGAVREAFLAHVIGGKELSRQDRFACLVRGATPDVVLTGVEVLASVSGRGTPGSGVVVVDVGGATTDVHSVVTADPEDAGLGREVVAGSPVTRTVEGDLGMRWSAVSTWAAGVADGLLEPGSEQPGPEHGPEHGHAAPAAVVRRTEEPGLLPDGETERALDRALASTACRLALRRHAGRSRVVVSPEGRVVERSGVDLRQVGLVVGSGGALRADPAGAEDLLREACRGEPGGWQLPERPTVVVDADYLLAPIGLLAPVSPEVASALARTLTP